MRLKNSVRPAALPPPRQNTHPAATRPFDGTAQQNKSKVAVQALLASPVHQWFLADEAQRLPLTYGFSSAPCHAVGIEPFIQRTPSRQPRPMTQQVAERSLSRSGVPSARRAVSPRRHRGPAFPLAQGED